MSCLPGRDLFNGYVGRDARRKPRGSGPGASGLELLDLQQDHLPLDLDDAPLGIAALPRDVRREVDPHAVAAFEGLRTARDPAHRED